MQTIGLHPVRLAPYWRPAPRALGQQVQAPPAPPPSAMPAPMKPPFIDSALVAAVQDFTGAFVTGILAYGATYPGGVEDPATGKRVKVQPSRWAWVFTGITAALIIKGLVDLSLIRER